MTLLQFLAVYATAGISMALVAYLRTPRFPLFVPHGDGDLVPVTDDQASPRHGAVAGTLSAHIHGEV